jgi:Uma2 family endonuclease
MIEAGAMAEPAIRRMTVDDFLRWEDGTDTRYELVEGCVVAMAPPAPRRNPCSSPGGAIDAALRSRPPRAAHGQVGIVRPDRDDTFYVADIAVTCDRLQPDDQLIRNPILVVEILSLSTANFVAIQRFPTIAAFPV